MRRRDFITLIGGAAVWPLAARAQTDQPRHIGMLIGYAENDPEAQVFVRAFLRGLQDLGWIEGRNLRIDMRWAGGDLEKMQTLARELVALQPDVILANSTPVTATLLRQTKAIPIVFVIVSDPVGAGFIESLSRPGGNATGFINIEASMGSKWLELLKEIAPTVTRVALMFNPDTAPGGGSYFLDPFQAAAPSLGVEPLAAPVHSDSEIEAAIASLGRQPGGGFIVVVDSFLLVHRATVIVQAARSKMPAVYPLRINALDGGLLSYGADNEDVFRRAAPYVDRVLRGAKPADLPVQVPTKFNMVLNLKTAKGLGLVVPMTLLARADEVIE
jgi:putative ABC transport system substrate-binding protein